MPFIEPNIASQINARNLTDLQSAVHEFELTIGAPVRVLKPEASRTVTRMVDNWSGQSANMEYYPNFTEQDRDEKGYTILMGSYNADVQGGHEGYRWCYLDQRFYPNWNRNSTAAEIEVRLPEINPGLVEQADGIPLSADTERNGEPITTTYGELYDRIAFLIFTPYQVTNWGAVDWSALLFDHIIENISPEAKAAADQRRAEVAREAFTRMMEDQGNMAIIELRKKADQISTRRGELEELLVNAKHDQQQIGTQLTYLLDSEGEMTAAEINAEWDAIARHAKVKSFTCGKAAVQSQQVEAPRRRRRSEEGRETGSELLGGWLKIRTEPLFLIRPDTKRKVPLGEYEITMHFGANSLSIKNVTNAQSEGHVDHPHVAGGRLCAADYGTTITELLRKRKLAGMTGMVFNILATLTMSDGTAVGRFRLFEEADDRVRRENGWPAWEDGEDEHPSLQDSQSGESDPESTESSTEDKTVSTDSSDDDSIGDTDDVEGGE